MPYKSTNYCTLGQADADGPESLARAPQGHHDTRGAVGAEGMQEKRIFGRCSPYFAYRKTCLPTGSPNLCCALGSANR